MSDQDEQERLKADIEATRAELAETADALAAKLDVKAQASKKVHEAGSKVSDRYTQVKGSAPAPVQKALGKTEQAVTPLMAQAAADKKRTFAVLGGAVVVVLVIRRVRRSRAK